jgi:hypothetical protein
MSDILTSVATEVRNSSETAAAGDLAERVIQVVAAIRAVPSDQLRSEVDSIGRSAFGLSSQEIVAVLVVLQPQTGIDPTDRDVLKDCEAQTVEQLLDLINTRRAGPA